MANITIVDDDFAIEILAENLRYFGHEVRRLANAQEALSNLDQLLESDLLILDIIMECPTDMPEAKISGGRTTGMTIFQRVREKRTDIPILAYSATSDRDVIDALRRDSYTRFLSKWSTPSLKEVLTTIENILGLQNSSALPRPFIVHTVIDRLAKKLAGFTTEELQYLIAESLQSQLYELIYVTQVIQDQNVLPTPKDDMRKRLQEAKSFTLVDYYWKIAVPLWQKQLGDSQADPESLLQRSSLAPIMDRLRSNPKVHILHNLDDFFAERKSIEALKEALGDQVTLFPYGGHLGNIWYPENKKTVLRILSSLS